MRPRVSKSLCDVGISIACSTDEVLAAVLSRQLFRTAPDCDRVDVEFELVDEADGSTRLTIDGALVARSHEPEQLLGVIEAALMTIIPDRSRSHVFLHAGVVGGTKGAILIVGHSTSGKSRLVQELAGRGMPYFSDDLAPLDASGLVHPFPKGLGLRLPEKVRFYDLESLGFSVASDPSPVGAVIVTHFEATASDPLRLLRSSEAAASLLVHLRSRPDERAISTVRALVAKTAVFAGPRPDAAAFASGLDDLLTKSS